MPEDHTHIVAASETGDPEPLVYDRRSLTYSNTFANPFKRNLISVIEWFTGKISILRMVRRFERMEKFEGQAFWRGALDVMGIDLLTPDEQVMKIPKTGPVIVVANHPHGLVDGMILAELIGRVRTDYRILTRSVLTGIDQDATKFTIPVPFPHEPDAQKKMVDMRRAAMEHLATDGVIAVFPSGVVGSSDTLFGPVIEREWNAFTAKMIRKSGAAVVPCYFPGGNSRWYQMANRISATLRQSLLLHEIVYACGKPQKPVIGDVITPDQIDILIEKQRQFMAQLRKLTMDLGKTA